MNLSYQFSHDGLLDSPNTYFYAPFQGEEFMKAWEMSRFTAARKMGTDRDEIPDSALKELGGGEYDEAIEIGSLLEAAMLVASKITPKNSGCLPWPIEELLKGFESSKKLPTHYQVHRRPKGPGFSRDLSNYLRLGEVFAVAFEASSDIRMLNALLKVNDICVGDYLRLNTRYRPRLVNLIGLERQFVANLRRSFEKGSA